VLVAWLAWMQYQQSETAYELRLTATETTQRANALLSSMKDAETGQRGYLLTGDEAFLAPYRTALKEVPTQLQLLHHLMKEPYPRLDVLTRLVNAKLADLGETIALAQQGDARSAVIRLQGGVGRDIVDELRAEVEQFLVHERSLLVQSESSHNTARYQLLAWMVLLSLLGVLASVTAALVVNRQAKARLQAQELAKALAVEKSAVLERLASHLRADDLQAQKQYHENMEARAHMVLAEKMSSIGTMVGGVAHEINNPLMGLLSYVEFVRDKTTDAKSVQVLDDALHEIHRIKKIVQNMLVFVRPDKAATDSGSVAQVAQQALNLFAGELKKHDITLAVDLPDNLPMVRCHSGGLQQVLLNLLLNARDAVAEQADKRIRIWAEQVDADIHLHISDNGPGVANGVRDKLFTPFFTTKAVGKGTGLGLAVSRQLMEQMGGAVYLENLPAAGTSFCIAMKVANSLEGDKQNDKRNSRD